MSRRSGRADAATFDRQTHHPAPEATVPPHPRWTAQISARAFASRHDRAIEAGVIPSPGTALAVHRTRLTSPRERAQLSGTLRHVMQDALGPHHRTALNARTPVCSQAVRAAVDVLAAVVDRLDDATAVRPRGVARLRLLLSDGLGPLYRAEAGSLNAALRGVLAAM